MNSILHPLTTKAPSCMDHTQTTISAVDNPFDRSLKERQLTLCVQTPEGQKYIVTAVINEVKATNGSCSQCTSFAHIESFSMRGKRTIGVKLKGGGQITIHG
jgi:hypothetical protein